jgi:rare lipoprotein A
MKKQLLIITVTTYLLCNLSMAASKTDLPKTDLINTVHSSKLTVEKSPVNGITPQKSAISSPKQTNTIKKPVTPELKSGHKVSDKPVWSQTGQASWYGTEFHGRKTASGEPFDMYQFTAAHPSLPIGTLLKVTNLRNKRTVVVRINDRGPFVGNRVIDLSYSAAQVLGYSENGVAKVRIERIERESLAANVTPTSLF